MQMEKEQLQLKDEKISLLFLRTVQLHIELLGEGAARLLLFGTEEFLRFRFLFACSRGDIEDILMGLLMVL
jgi:hypothetical protein